MLTIGEALALASMGYYVACNDGNMSYVGYEVRAEAHGQGMQNVLSERIE